jgi:hypothetical protein
MKILIDTQSIPRCAGVLAHVARESLKTRNVLLRRSLTAETYVIRQPPQ